MSFTTVVGDIWQYHDLGYYILIPTNNDVQKNGELVMGAGVALQAKNKFPLLARYLGLKIRHNGNKVIVAHEERVISFPTKHSWRDRQSDLKLIHTNAISLREMLFHQGIPITPIYSPKLGTGFGGLPWQAVESTLSRLDLEHYVIFVELPK
jgi:hypothetical protein